MAANPNAGHPGNDYYVSVTGTIQAQANPALAFGLKETGYSGPYDWATAKSVANNVAQRTERGVINAEAGPVQNAATTAGASAAGNLTGLSAIGDFFGTLTQSATWIRIAKVIIGGTLLIIGLAHMTGADNSVATAARKVPLPI